MVVDEKLLALNNADIRRDAIVHLYGVSSYATLLAKRRGLDQEMAAIAGLLHDYYLFTTGIEDFHDQNGAEAVRPILRDMGIFSVEEQRTLLRAIFYHSDKCSVHGPYDELIKDAELLQGYVHNLDQQVRLRNPTDRLRRVLTELAIPYDEEFVEVVEEMELVVSASEPQDKRAALADLAESLASKGIVGIPAEPLYREICQYWPDSNIYIVLMDSWCAAFVYHCCRQVGFKLPIRYPIGVCRFAGVAAWQEWAQLPEIQYFHSSQDKDFTPQRGDILIYEKLLSEQSHDHIGIVLACDEDELLVAEGNKDNKNQSALIRRDRWSKISGFVRIANDYAFTFKGEYNPQLTAPKDQI